MNESQTISRLLAPLGFSLNREQLYTSGERFLKSSSNTIVLAGTEKNGDRVVIKASNKPEGKKEIESEKRSRDLMRSLVFADKKITIPEERYFGTVGGYTLLIMRFIPQEKVFVAHSPQEQFFIALSAFEAQESFHATTFGHLRSIKDVFPILSSADYLREFKRIEDSISKLYQNELLKEVLVRAEGFLKEHSDTIDRHTSYLTHTDFVPHNFRIAEHTLYMLDCVPNYATVHFGNKYEGWARFLNYMLIHNPELERLLADYIRKNRGEDEYLSLRLMRAYKIAFLFEFYAHSLAKTSGNLHELTLARLAYWREALISILEDRPLATEVTEQYKKTRDALRSEEEKERQRDFAIA